jgi:hypothetical protein
MMLCANQSNVYILPRQRNCQTFLTADATLSPHALHPFVIQVVYPFGGLDPL